MPHLAGQLCFVAGLGEGLGLGGGTGVPSPKPIDSRCGSVWQSDRPAGCSPLQVVQCVYSHQCTASLWPASPSAGNFGLLETAIDQMPEFLKGSSRCAIEVGAPAEGAPIKNFAGEELFEM